MYIMRQEKLFLPHNISYAYFGSSDTPVFLTQPLKVPGSIVYTYLSILTSPVVI